MGPELTGRDGCGILLGVRAIVIRGPGGPEVLEYRMLPDPPFGPEDVRVAVRASALNRADLLQRRGLYPAPPGAPADIPGLEFAGEVEACGDRVVGLSPGDRVMGIVGGGGHAEKLALHERLCMKIPPGLTWEEAAAVPEAFLTAFDALLLTAGLAPGETVLLHAAASGVGTAAAQIARVSGARAIGLSRSASKRERLRELGVDHVLDASSGRLAEEILRATASGGVDVVLDLLGASSWALNLAVLAVQGRIVVVGLMGGFRTEVDLSELMRKRARVIGTVLRSRPLEQRIELVRRFTRQMLPLLADGRLRPVVDRALPLSEAAAAHRLMERNANFGKIVLTLA
jgi:putative PIG3 family NAD(P)H quinone oxidoreductase